MGIPRFYRFITEQFPAVSEQVSFKGGIGDLKIDNLYLDANGILHNCAREVCFPDKGEAPKKPQIKIFEAVVSYIDQLFKFVKPQKVFYIAIDGPAPLAKQAQQRQRRYRSADEKDPQELAIFDSTAITPGTTFMHQLGKYLHYFINKKLTMDSEWQRVKVIFSGSNVAGEGEHKIVQYIRESGSKDDSHCMYGLDADLFMLSLCTHCPKFYLLREDQFKTAWDDTLFYKVDIGLLRKEIFTHWGGLGGDIERLMDEFVFMCFLVGNDFLHALPSCYDLTPAIIYIMDLRKKVLGGKYITKPRGKFDLNNFTNFLTALEKSEKSLIYSQYYKQNFPNLTLNNSLIDPRQPSKGINLDKYRRLYYKKAGVDVDSAESVSQFCRQYLEGLEWVQFYYHAKAKNWHWYYPYHYTPLVKDLVGYLTTAGNSLSRISTQESEPVLPFQQLLCVVPPKSKYLLPKYLHPVYEDPKLKEFYPEKYKIDLEGKNREWEGIALLPFIRLDFVLKAYRKATKEAKEKKLKTNLARNKLKSTLCFSRSTEIKYRYHSEYGDIPRCSVVIDTMEK